MSRSRIAFTTFLLVSLPASMAQAQEHNRSSEGSSISLERYCQDQTGSSDLTAEDLEDCRELLDLDFATFDVLDDAADPLARQDPADDLGFDARDGDFQFDLIDSPDHAGRTGRALKKTTGTDDDFDFDFEDEDEPDLEEEFGFDFEFEGQEEPEDPIELFDFEPLDDPDDDPLGELDGIPEEEPEPRPSQAASATGSALATPAGIQLDVVGKIPLSDNYEPQIVAYDRDSVVVELPVLLGRSRADFDGIAYCVVAEVYSDGNKVAEARQQVTSASLAEFGPSFAFIKMLAPVTAKSGKLEIRLSKASNMSAQPTQLFARTVGYQLP